MLELLTKALGSYSPKIVDGPSTISAGVLVPVFEKDNDMFLVLTKRTGTVGVHKNEVSFPGGMYEDVDGNMLNTAIRECQEEIGVQPEHIDVIGRIDDIGTMTGFIITPYVGIIPYPYRFETNPHEVAYLIYLPYSYLEAAVPVMETAEHNGITAQVHSIHYNGDRIWGATCRILLRLRQVIEDAKVQP